VYGPVCIQCAVCALVHRHPRDDGQVREALRVDIDVVECHGGHWRVCPRCTGRLPTELACNNNVCGQSALSIVDAFLFGVLVLGLGVYVSRLSYGGWNAAPHPASKENGKDNNHKDANGMPAVDGLKKD
jgi:hypothetical protein